MPKLPVVSSDEVIKALSKFGFIVSSQRGSHVKLRKGSLSLIVPRHNELGKGILRKIIKQAGITPDEFLEAL